jgi:HD-GYP domain-containing protein (c-di-GMP phosphodiesterase class II)
MDELLIAAERALEHRGLLIERREHQVVLERRVEEATRELAATLHELESTYRTTLEALGSAIDTRDLGTHAHSRRVRGYSLAIARAYGMPEVELRDLEHGCSCTTSGRSASPTPSSSSRAADARGVEDHADAPGDRPPARRADPVSARAVPIVYHHHERWDGTGYPLGLKGEQIPWAPASSPSPTRSTP